MPCALRLDLRFSEVDIRTICLVRDHVMTVIVTVLFLSMHILIHINWSKMIVGGRLNQGGYPPPLYDTLSPALTIHGLVIQFEALQDTG